MSDSLQKKSQFYQSITYLKKVKHSLRDTVEKPHNIYMLSKL